MGGSGPRSCPVKDVHRVGGPLVEGETCLSQNDFKREQVHDSLTDVTSDTNMHRGSLLFFTHNVYNYD